jgi:uncharacterized membrane protein
MLHSANRAAVSRAPVNMPEITPDSAEQHRGVMIVLAYLWLLALVPLWLDKNDREVQWHAKHGVVLMLAELGVLLLYILVTSVVSLATLGVGCALIFFLVFAWVGVLALHVVAIIKGINGGRLIVPGVSEYADRM